MPTARRDKTIQVVGGRMQDGARVWLVGQLSNQSLDRQIAASVRVPVVRIRKVWVRVCQWVVAMRMGVTACRLALAVAVTVTVTVVLTIPVTAGVTIATTTALKTRAVGHDVCIKTEHCIP